MSLSSLPLSYCTNVHPGQTLDEVKAKLESISVPVCQTAEGDVAAGLWLADSVVRPLAADIAEAKRFAEWLSDRELTCYTLNAFPFGDFHRPRVKENVYLPDWTDPNRSRYTLDCAKTLAAILPAGVEGSISTVPLGFKELCKSDGFLDACCQRLAKVARQLDELRELTGKTIRLAIEPEPLCVLETTEEFLQFFDRLRNSVTSGAERQRIDTHLGACFDVCHQSVEFENVALSLRQLDDAGIYLAKVHITNAIQVDRPAERPEARAALASFAEPRYLHQTFGRKSDGTILRLTDLSKEFADEPGAAFLECEQWRVHFHVPVNESELGELGTTRHDLQAALTTVHELSQTPHLEVETYTWPVLPRAADELRVGLTRELDSTHQMLEQIQDQKS